MSHERKQGPCPPVSIGERVSLVVNGLSHEGDGVGRKDGFAVFVPGALPGEEVTATVTAVAAGFARAELERVEGLPSPARTAPPCPLFDRCGGCQLQHMTYEAQLSFKRQKVVDALTRIGGFGTAQGSDSGREFAAVTDCLPSPEIWHYRSKARFFVDGGAIGFRARRSHRVVDVERCPIQSPLNNKVLAAARSLPRVRGLRRVEARSSRALDQAVVTLVADPEGGPAPELVRLADSLRALVPEVTGVMWGPMLAPGRTSSEPGIDWSNACTISGRPESVEVMCGLTLRASPRSFLQVNPAQAERLYDLVAACTASLPPGYHAYDLYCGVGAISLVLASAGRAGTVTGIEVERRAVDDARANAEVNHLLNVSFEAGPVESRVGPEAGGGAQVGSDGPLAVVLDPPRSGCRPSVVDFLALADLVVYVSCDAATLARDLGRLRSALPPRTMECLVHPVDMFPQTAHVECVAVATPRSARPSPTRDVSYSADTAEGFLLGGGELLGESTARARDPAPRGRERGCPL